MSGLPILTVVVLIASGRVTTATAGTASLLVAAAIACTPLSPQSLTIFELGEAIAKGLWVSCLIAAIILGGLLFRTLVDERVDAGTAAPRRPYSRRQAAFAACFLIGPFTEAVTGFGLGQVATAAALTRLGLPPRSVAILGLFSGILVPWGAMANGTVVGAQVAGIPVADLGLRSAVLTAPLLMMWLLIFWRMARHMGLPAGGWVLMEEAGWTLMLAVLLILSDRALGPEITGVAAVGCLLGLHHWRSVHPTARQWVRTGQAVIPYVVLVIGFSTTRAVPALTAMLAHLASIRPFADCPAWQPLLHPATWLVGLSCLVALVGGRRPVILPAIIATWKRGRLPVLTIAVFLVSARIMADTGMARQLAEGLRQPLGDWAILATPVAAASLGFLIGSLNAANSLLMEAQFGLAQERGQMLWVAALQNTSAAALTMLSPARVATGCALAGDPRLVRSVYAAAWPIGIASVVLLLGAAAMVIVIG